MTSPNDKLFLGSDYARQGMFGQMLAMLDQAIEMAAIDETLLKDTLLKAANLCVEYGQLNAAQLQLSRVLQLDPQNLQAQAALAKVATDRGQHGQARGIYQQLIEQLPDHDVIRRNFLVALQYDPDVSEGERYKQALNWGDWAIERAGGALARPQFLPLDGRLPRVGFVSADFCQHTVGLFVKDVLCELGKRWPLFAYSASETEDWVSKQIKTRCHWRPIARQDDRFVANQIKQDQIDILVDLSGHTAGSRLTVFAHRPAPVMVSWLGYFATTGLSYMDAILLDPWCAPKDTEQLFVEPINQLPSGRFYFCPAPWTPKTVGPVPCLRHGHVTFGCFNNTAKLNPLVWDLWARVLKAVPDSRLILKWRTFNDDALREAVYGEFTARAIEAHRIELRGPGFHVDVLKEYADIDIALDPFPFTGGMTSCEALWMGVPVVTWPQSTLVSRQTYALLSAIGMTHLAAHGADEYVQIARDLATDIDQLVRLREGLRAKMQAADMMKLSPFVDQIQQALLLISQQVLNEKTSPH